MRMMFKDRRHKADENKNNKGFTLVEVIISIAALGLICAVLLRLFVVAGNTNDMARDAQEAELTATSAMETLVCADTLKGGLAALSLPALDYTANDVIFETQTDAGLLMIDIMNAGGDYPGTLYTVAVFVLDDNRNELARIATKKYEREAANE